MIKNQFYIPAVKENCPLEAIVTIIRIKKSYVELKYISPNERLKSKDSKFSKFTLSITKLQSPITCDSFVYNLTLFVSERITLERNNGSSDGISISGIP